MTEKDKFLQRLESILANHDWFYQYSDDPTKYRKGKSSKQEIIFYMNTLTQKGYRDEAETLYKKYSNKFQ